MGENSSAGSINRILTKGIRFQSAPEQVDIELISHLIQEINAVLPHPTFKARRPVLFRGESDNLEVSYVSAVETCRGGSHRAC